MMGPEMMTAVGGWMMFGMGAVCLLAVAALIKYLRSPGG